MSKNLKILHSYVRFSTRNLGKIRQDPGSKYMQISYCDGHARSRVNIVVKSWKFIWHDHSRIVLLDLGNFLSKIIQESCYRTVQDLSQDKARYWFQIHSRSYCDNHARS